jgi:hypothetical protein
MKSSFRAPPRGGSWKREGARRVDSAANGSKRVAIGYRGGLAPDAIDREAGSKRIGGDACSMDRTRVLGKEDLDPDPTFQCKFTLFGKSFFSLS